MGSTDLQTDKHNEGIIGSTLHFLFQNVYAFTVSIMGLVHVVLLLFMIVTGVWPLVQFNVLSVVVYIFCFLLCRSEHIMPVYISIILEVMAYTVVSTHYIGLSCGTYCFQISIVPIIIYFGCHLLQGKKRWTIVGLLAGNFLVFTILHLIYAGNDPVYELSYVPKLTILIYSSFVMVFSMIFYNMMYIYASELEYGNLERKNRQLSSDAHEDALTNLLNRRGFLPMVESLMKDERKSHFCIAFCDLDDFKRVNDTYGHDAGDEVLKHMTKLIVKDLNDCDICRWGGEEIVILMRNCDLDTAKERLERIRKRVESNPTVFYSHKISVTITIGLEENHGTYSSAEDIIKAADERMYYGKQHGKNVVIFEDK